MMMLATDDAVLAAVLDSPWERMQAEPPVFVASDISEAFAQLVVDDEPFDALPGERTIRVATDLSWTLDGTVR